METNTAIQQVVSEASADVIETHEGWLQLVWANARDIAGSDNLRLVHIVRPEEITDYPGLRMYRFVFEVLGG